MKECYFCERDDVKKDNCGPDPSRDNKCVCCGFGYLDEDIYSFEDDGSFIFDE